MIYFGLFSDVYNSSSHQGMWLFRPKVKLRVDYDIRGASGGYNYAYQGGKGRRITGSFYLGAGAYLQAWVGRRGGVYYNSTYDWAAGGGGGCSGLSVYRTNTFNNTSYMFPVVIAAGGGGAPGGYQSTSNLGSYVDAWSALPL